MKRKWIRYITRTIVVCLSTWILLLGIALVYIKINKEQILTTIKADLNRKINGKIVFDDLRLDLFENFPGISIDLRNLHILDSVADPHKKELLQVKHAYMGFGIIGLLTGKKSPSYLTLTDGTIFLFKDTLGNKNWDILKIKSSPGKKNIVIKKVTLKRMNGIFQDDSKFKFYDIWFEKTKCSISDTRNQIKFEFENKAVVKKACFNTIKGSYLTNKRWTGDLHLLYDRNLAKLFVQNQLVKLDRQSYRVTGDFTFGDDPYFNLSIKTNSLALTEAASIFPPEAAKRIKQFDMSKPLQQVEASLTGPMKYLSYPLATISFFVKDASIGISETRFEHCSFNGFFRNEFDSTKIKDDRNSFFRFTNVSGEWEKNSFDSKSMAVYNLLEPYLRCDIHTRFDLVQLEKAISSQRLDFNGGTGEATVNYSGPLATKTDTVSNLDGSLKINHGNITYNPRNLHFTRTDIDIQFRNGDLLVKKMNTVVNENDIRINGTVAGFLTFFNTDPSKAVFNWNIYSPLIDVSKLKSSMRRSTAIKKKQKGYSFFENLNNKIDRLFDACNAYLSIRADKVVYKKFSAVNVNGNLSLTNDMIKLDNFSLQHAGGSVLLNASSKDNGNTSALAIRSKLQNVNVSELFSSFNNFGMASLTSKNISGNFSAEIDLTSTLDANYDLNSLANRGQVNFSLKNGRLQNFQPLMDIDNNFLKKRNLQDISFAELKNKLDLSGSEVQVHLMEIQSTAISMYVEGVYSFGDKTDLSIQIPFKDMKKKDLDDIPQNKGVNAKKGPGIFLRAKDENGKLKIGYDLFGRFRKKNS
jgi:hypothetical protein